MRKLTLLLCALLAGISLAVAQTSISGTVLSAENDEPVIGASILVKGANASTITDTDGKFTIKIPAGASRTLVISYIGMEKQEVFARNGMVVKLNSADHTLDDVVVVGYQTIRKEAKTGSIATVDGDDLASIPETSVDKMMAQLRSYPVYFWTEKVLKVLFTGYIPAPKEKEPLFYIGMMNTTISGNTLEGVRLRAGGMTTAWLNPHLFGRGYMAYGFRDHRVKGLAELEYSFHRKKEYANEFPIHSLKLRYLSDVNQYGQHYLYTSQDNVFLALKRQKDDRIGYQRKAELTYTNEFHSGFSVQMTTRLRKDESSHLIPFVKQDDHNTYVKSISTSELELKLRYAPNEKFFQTQWNRFPVSLDAPVFSLTHTMAAKGVLGGDYTYHYTEAGFQKRFWFSAFGYTDVILKAGKVWNKVPFPLLVIPNANLSYTIQPESYSLMNAMEFMNDEYASWDVTYYLNGWLFNRIPLLKKLKWREVLSCRGLYGNLSDKNNPAFQQDLFRFPAGSTTMGHTPYVEAGVGVENIFKVLRVDYVWRLTYRDLPNIDKSGLRISLHMTF